MLLGQDVPLCRVWLASLVEHGDMLANDSDKLRNLDTFTDRCELECANLAVSNRLPCAQCPTHIGIRSPAQKALCGRVKLYMTLPGQVFSISSVCIYSPLSGESPLTTCMGRLAEILWPNMPDLIAMAFS